MSFDLKKLQVVVVEDNADNLFIITDILREEIGVQYCNARASGWQFFKLLETNKNLEINLVLLDIQIPHEDGYAILKQIRVTPQLKDVKVIAVTANVMPEDVQRAKIAGFDGFIGKPINADRLPNQVSRVMNGEEMWEPR